MKAHTVGIQAPIPSPRSRAFDPGRIVAVTLSFVLLAATFSLALMFASIPVVIVLKAVYGLRLSGLEVIVPSVLLGSGLAARLAPILLEP